MSENYAVPAVCAAIRILAELVHVDRDGATQADLARETGVSKSSMHNLLATLEREGYVRRDERTRRYTLGGALIPLGAAAARQVRTLTLAIDRLPALAAEHGLSMAVAQLTPDADAQVIERAYPTQPVHVGIRIGSRYGYFDGAIGKVLLAGLEAGYAAALLHARAIPVHTVRTITDADALLAEVEIVAARGWAASIGEYNSNIAVAAPFAGAGGPEGLLLALGFPSDIPESRVPEVGAALREAADWVTASAGGQITSDRSSNGRLAHR
jgi:IclR family acetate operon transcriptional repressor